MPKKKSVISGEDSEGLQGTRSVKSTDSRNSQNGVRMSRASKKAGSACSEETNCGDDVEHSDSNGSEAGTSSDPLQRRSVASGSLRRRRRSAANFQDELEELDEESFFLRILDMLEEQDEFDSTSAVDDLSAYDPDSDCDSPRSVHTPESSDDEEEREDMHLSFAPSPNSPNWSFAEPVLEDWVLAAAWHELRGCRLPSLDVAASIIRDVTKLYGAGPTLVHIDRPKEDGRIVVVGDLHGHFSDLMHIIDKYGEPSNAPGGTQYLFNGDFVDRGAWGPEVLVALYCLKLRHKDAVHLNRGNHEDQGQNTKPDNGFAGDHCVRAWSHEAQTMYRLCWRSFKQLPLCHVIGKEIFVVHGGLSLDTCVTLQEINSIDRKHAVPMQMCNLLGYPVNQLVKAKRTLTTMDGDELPAGYMGRLVHRIGKSGAALAKFGQDEVEVQVAGAPELEQDVEIIFKSEADKIRQRKHRLFASLLWSDPASTRGPSKRGLGFLFDAKVTKEFLQVNRLKLLLRSHEKQPNGFREEHVDKLRGLQAATVFSASNYPSGAGEPAGNKASVVVIEAVSKGDPLTKAMSPATPWTEPYSVNNSRYRPSVISGALKSQLHEGGESKEVSTRAVALEKIRNMIYSARPKLLNFWQRTDQGTGNLSSADWVKGMRACVVPDEDFPWEKLAANMIEFDSKSRFNYPAYLARYENLLSRRLAERWHGGVIMKLAPGVSDRQQAEDAWSLIDVKRKGMLTYTELRPLLRSSECNMNPMTDDDRVYSVLASLDHDRNGFVDRDEFVEKVVATSHRRSEMESMITPKQTRSADRKATTASIDSRTKHFLDNEMLKSGGDTAILQCWTATQEALRILSSARSCALSVFRVMDEDSDGLIDREEFLQGLSRLLQGSPLLQTVDQWEPLLWQLIDEDRSGYVSASELADAFRIREIVAL